MLKYIILLVTFISLEAAAEAPIPLPPLPNEKENTDNDKNIVNKNLSIKKEDIATKKIPIKIGFNSYENDLYLPLASAICIFINEEKDTSCRLKQYNDSVSALNGMLNGDIDVIITSALIGDYALNGKGSFNKNNMQLQKMRFITSFFDLKLSIVARRDSNIKTLDDMKNASLNIGKKFTNQRIIFDEILKIKKWDIEGLKGLAEIDKADLVKAICNKNVDATFIVEEDKSKYMKEATRLCEVTIIGLTSDDLQLFENGKSILRNTIPGGTYVGSPHKTETIGTKAVMLTTSDISNNQIELLMTIINKNLRKIKLLDENLSTLSIERMISEGKIAQPHGGLIEFMNKNNLKEVN
jgi:TRAP transporter TAXI family solute receptor